MWEDCENITQGSNYYDQKYFDGPFLDEPKAKELKDQLLDVCDIACMSRGCRWSHIYKLNAVLIWFYFAVLLVCILGVENVSLRIFGFCC